MLKARAVAATVMLAFVAVMAGCGAQATPTPSTSAVLAEDVWVRSTDNKTDTTMTSLFMSLVNPSDEDISLTSAECDVAGRVELHETVEIDGNNVMREVDAIDIPAGSHTHLRTGGDHVMLMDLAEELPVGSEVTVTLHFSTGQALTVTAPVKDLTEESEHYHPSESASASPS